MTRFNSLPHFILRASGAVGEARETVNLLPLVELVRIHPCPPDDVVVPVRLISQFKAVSSVKDKGKLNLLGRLRRHFN